MLDHQVAGAARPSLLVRWQNLRIGQRIATGFALVTAFTLLTSATGWWGTHQLDDALRFVTGPAWATADGAMEGVIGIEKQMLAVERYAAGTQARDESIAMLKDGTAMADDALGRVAAAGQITPDRVTRMQAHRAAFDAARAELWRAAETGKGTPPDLHRRYEAAADALLTDIDEFEEQGDAKVEGYVAVAQGIIAKAYVALAGALLVAVLCAFVAARSVVRSVTQPIGIAVRVADQVASGNLDERIHVDTNDETGQLLKALQRMQGELRARLAQERAQAEAVRKIQSAMDQASGAMVLIDTDDRVLFANHSMKATCARIPRIGARELVGQPVARLLEAADQGTTLAELRARRNAGFEFGPFSFQLYSSPVTNEQGAVIGTVVEWQDLSQQRAAEREMARVLEDAVHGRLKSRLDTSLMHGFMGELGANVNRLLDAIVAPIDQTAHYLARISCGDIPDTVQHRFEGDFRAIEDNLERCMHAIRTLVRDTSLLAGAAAEGKLGERADAAAHEGDFRRIVQGVNEAIDAIAVPVRETQRIMQALADGDLTQEMSGNFNGDFARMQASVNGSVAQLRQLIESITAGADLISASSSEIKNGNLDLSNRTERQATSVQQTTTHMGEVTEMVRRNTEQARQANDMAASAAAAAREGGDVVGRAVQAMSEIDHASKEIADIIGVVDEIAFQTNLLALNASVEAARAGEQGRGFAVVAGEVRNLAQRSAQAARQVKDLINASVSRVSEGSELVRASGDTLARIVNAVGAVSGIISGIADDSDAQYDGIQRIGNTLREIDEGTQQNAAMVEEVASASASMDEQASTLREQVAAFRIHR